MSWFDAFSACRNWPRQVTLLLLLCLGLSACGFAPTYQQRADNGPIIDQLSSIAIVQARDQRQQILHNQLIDKLQRKQKAKIYTLDSAITVSTTGLGRLRNDDTSRNRVDILVQAQLVGQGKSIQFRVRNSSSYSLNQSAYTNQVSLEDAIRRTLETIADDLVRQLGLYFQDPSIKETPAS